MPTPKRDEWTADHFEKLAEELDRLKVTCTDTARMLKSCSVELVKLTHIKTMQRGLEFVQTFVMAAHAHVERKTVRNVANLLASQGEDTGRTKNRRGA